ncbi:hypothetical protein Tco_0173858 [Tanacetum coccineum]|uniref:Uncharacterized protein n=1 Tax=Tanacetum coccineum TaxID=301880 RepID=A0ABQ5J493_9ASTR
MVGYSYPVTKGYRVDNKRTRLIVESIHIKFDEIKKSGCHDHRQFRTSQPQRQEIVCLKSVSFFRALVPQDNRRQLYDNSDPMPPRPKFVTYQRKIPDSSQQGHGNRWTRDPPLEQSSWKSMPSQFKTRTRQLATDPGNTGNSATKSTTVAKGYAQEEGMNLKKSLLPVALLEKSIVRLRHSSLAHGACTQVLFSNLSDGRENSNSLNGPLGRRRFYVAQPEGSLDARQP